MDSNNNLSGAYRRYAKNGKTIKGGTKKANPPKGKKK